MDTVKRLLDEYPLEDPAAYDIAVQISIFEGSELLTQLLNAVPCVLLFAFISTLLFQIMLFCSLQTYIGIKGNI